jgi:hypothetical protein
MAGTGVVTVVVIVEGAASRLLARALARHAEARRGKRNWKRMMFKIGWIWILVG